MIDTHKIRQMYNEWHSITAIQKEMPEFSYWYIRRHMISKSIYKNWEARSKYMKKRALNKEEVIEAARELIKQWTTVKEAAKVLWTKYNTLIVNIRSKLKEEWVRIYNWKIVDYWDYTRDCLDCWKRTSIINCRCEECRWE